VAYVSFAQRTGLAAVAAFVERPAPNRY